MLSGNGRIPVWRPADRLETSAVAGNPCRGSSAHPDRRPQTRFDSAAGGSSMASPVAERWRACRNGLAVTRSGYLLRFPRQCDFVVSADATRIDTRPHRQVAPEILEHLLADQVLPRCLAQRGELVAHAAGIAFGRDIALFVGESGRGKSTLAGLFPPDRSDGSDG